MRKKKNFLGIILSTMLFANITQGSETDTMRIEMGQEAPYSGVLMSPQRFMFEESEMSACRYIQDHPLPCEDTDMKDTIASGAFGFALGILATLFVKK